METGQLPFLGSTTGISRENMNNR